MEKSYVRIIGAGLAGSEAALFLANLGVKVELYEMKSHKKTPAQKLEGFAELVCSNSFRSSKSTNAVGLLKEEMLLAKSELMQLALKAKVPAGDCLAVDREVFSSFVTEKIKNEPLIELKSEEILQVPQDDVPTVIATGPLTSHSLAESLKKLIGEESLAFYDAIAPIVEAESIDMEQAFIKNRWQDEAIGDYINCPMDKEIYEEFVKRLNSADLAKTHKFEDAHYFEGCLPIEVMAKRGMETLRFGPFKPVGLMDPKISQKAHAVLQLRKEDIFGTSYNLVGCQTKMTISEQKEAFSLIPALKNAKFMRYGSVHKNTYVNSPKILNENLSIKNRPNIYLAGQITGVEGYVESMACGLIVANLIIGKRPFPKETMLGGLYNHICGHLMADKKAFFTPSNITWAMVPPLENFNKKNKSNKKEILYNRAMQKLKDFLN